MDHERIYLWNDGCVPGFRSDVSQPPPHIVPFQPKDSVRARGAVLVCPGGAYGGLYAEEGRPVAEWLNSLGFAAFLLTYRHSPYLFPCPFLDAQRALRLIRFNLEKRGCPASPLGVIGSSAGGHLAAMTGLFHAERFSSVSDEIDEVSARPDFMILCYPVITLGKHRNNDSLANLLGEPPPDPLRRRLSLENSVTAETPPTFLWQTADDELVPIENSLLMARSLANKKVPFSLHIFPNGRHGLGVTNERPDVHKWTSLCAEWLETFCFKG